jgi:hypothetical protein
MGAHVRRDIRIGLTLGATGLAAILGCSPGRAPNSPGSAIAGSGLSNAGQPAAVASRGNASSVSGAAAASGSVASAQSTGGGGATGASRAGGGAGHAGGATGAGASANSGASGGAGKRSDAGASGTYVSGTSGGGTSGSGTSGGGTSGGGGNPPDQPPPPIQGGSNGWASRYWDCCKPACGWTGNVRAGKPMASCNQQNQSLGGNYDTRNACDSGGSAYMCWNAVPWMVSSTLSYGFAAVSGANYVCGRCYQIQFNGAGHSGNNPGASSLNGKMMIVQVINNGGVAADQIDLLIPGGGVGALNACSMQWGTTDLGAQYGGFLAACSGGSKSCVQQKCQSVFAGKPDLQAGCDWFLNWFNAADNPNLVFKKIACPTAITQRSGLQDPG